jgi:hypothetical protein
MVLLIRKEPDNLLFKVVLSIIVILIIIVILYLLWRFVAVPISEGRLLGIRVACTTAPAAPTNLRATVTNDTQITVQWDRSLQTDSYVLYLGSSSNFSTVAAERSIPTAANQLNLLNVTPGPHYLKVVAINSCGQSAVSSEILITTTAWPTRFKLCKSDSPDLCLLMQTDGAFARLSKACPNNQCSIHYDAQVLIKNADRNLCLQSASNSSPPLIEVPVSVKTCDTSTNSWTIDPLQGRIRSREGLCLGANSQDSAILFNTSCNLISNDRDTRYNWVVVGM